MLNPSIKFALVALVTSTPLLSASAISLGEISSIAKSQPLSKEQTAAVEDLRYHLQKITGKELSSVVEAKPSSVVIEPLTEASDDYWAIDIAQDRVVLSGGERGLGYAISLFLEKHCGVRWLWPGPSGEVFLKTAGEKLTAGKEDGQPLFVRRELKFSYWRYWTPEMKEEVIRWKARTRLGDALTAGFGHSWSRMIPADRYFEKHPEWFGLVDGKRIPAQLCTSHSGLRDEFAKRLEEEAKTSKLDVLSVSANDGFGFCECELCAAKGTPGDAYWDFVNEMALRFKKTNPDKGLGSFAYTIGRQPPAKIERLPDNVYLSMTTYAASMTSQEGRKEFREFVDGWKSKGIKIVMREYWGMHYWLDLPVLFPDEIGETILAAKEAGLIGLYGETGKNFSTQALNYYVLTRLAWNPELSVKEITDDFYQCFGAAKNEVREYIEILRNAMHNQWKKDGYDGRYVAFVNLYGEAFHPAVIERADAALKKAEAKAASEADLQQRLAFLRKGLDYTRVMGELLDLYSKLGLTGFPLESFEWEATARLARQSTKTPRFTYSRDFFEERRKRPFSFTLEQKDEWLIRAWDLGQERVRILNENRDTPALDEGLLATTLERGMREWHQTVGHYLGKPSDEIVPLEYTKKAVR